MTEQAQEPTRIQKIIGTVVIKAYQLKQKIKPAPAAPATPPAAPQQPEGGPAN
ncbi:hypothetical protein [Williamsia sp.]|uniref:hypothetical protein n=1 Tax=Williamsia sp. TaxID=1872085 RepID=UPI002F95B53E